MAAARKINPIHEAIKLGTWPLIFAGVFSLVSNVLYLFFPIYTQQVYGRVLMSHSGATLFVLTLGVLVVFVMSSALDGLRTRVLANYGLVFDRYLSGPLFATLFESAARGNPIARAQALRDLDQFRAGLTGPATALLFDAPFVPIFFFVLFILDPALGFPCLVGGAILMTLALLQDRSTRASIKRSNDETVQSYAFTDAALRNSEVVRALGMTPALSVQWSKHRSIAQDRIAKVSDSNAFYSNAIKAVRMSVQVLMIALSAWLIMRGELHGGLLFANMILAARALAPIERVVNSWTTLVNAGQAYSRLNAVFAKYEPPAPATALPRPEGHLILDRVGFGFEGTGKLLVNNAIMDIPPGMNVGIVGSSGAGKSTLLRLIVGVWKPLGGTVRLDGADINSWDRTAFGQHVGYLPQDVELFAGTVRDNIARFRRDATDDDVVAAGQLSGAHRMILNLPKGYDTEVGEGGAVLSGGQRQRVALARALFGSPSLVVLDEPNASLDTEGEDALLTALEELKRRKVTVVIASHKPNIFRVSDHMFVMKDGRFEAWGPRNEIIARLVKPAAPAPASEARSG